MLPEISSLSLRLYLNSLDRCMIEISSGLPRMSSAIFGKFLETVQQRSCDLRTNFGESSEIVGKWSQMFRKIVNYTIISMSI